MFHFKANNLTRKSFDGKVQYEKDCKFTKNDLHKKTDWVPVNNHPKIDFECELESRRCEHLDEKTGQRCKRNTRKILPFCFSHQLSEYHVIVKKSNIKNAGLGLFVCDTKKGKDDIVFRKGDQIAIYARKGVKGKPNIGERLTNMEFTERYGECLTAPYGMDENTKRGMDTACQRSTGSYANGTHRSYANCDLYWNRSKTECWLYAEKVIRNGEEILWDYGRQYKHEYPDQFELKVWHTKRRESDVACRRRSKSPNRQS